MAGGQAITSGQGTLTPSETKALDGSEAVFSAGSVEVDGSEVSDALVGDESTSSAGDVSGTRFVSLRSRKVGGGSAARELTGSASTPSAGTATPTRAVLLGGLGISGSQGAFTKQRARLLSGSSSAANAGTVTVSGASQGQGDFASRISGPGVVWYHDFDTPSEVNQFRWTSGFGGGQDPNASGSGGQYVTHVATGGADGGGFMRLTYPLGSASGRGDSYWWRPFNPLTGATNGRGTNDPGAGGTITPSAFSVSSGSSTLNSWGADGSNPGYYGHATHVAANPTRFQGNDFYLQVRVRRAQTPGAPPDNAEFSNITGKNVWLTSTVSSYVAQEIVTYGQSAGAGDQVGVQSRHLMYDGQNFNPLGVGSQPNETTTLSNWTLNWRFSGGWDTLLYHITPGTQGGTGSNRTRVEVWAQKDPTLFPAENGVYTKIWDTTFTQSFNTSNNGLGGPAYPGWNGLILAIYHNGASFTTTAFNFDYDQVIFSKQTIAAPTVVTLPSWVPSTLNQWVQIPGTSMSSVPASPPPSTPGNTGPAAKFDAWTSFVCDRRNSRVYSVANGGHHDYPGNEVFQLTLETDTPGWSQVRAPYVGSYPDDTDYYAANEPAARHTYYGATFDEYTGTGRAMLWGGGRWGNGQLSTRGDAFNFNTNSYSPAGTIPNIPSGSSHFAFGCCADTNTGDMYLFGNFAIYRWNRSANTMQTLTTSSTLYAQDHASAFDSTRNRFFIVGSAFGNQARHTYTTSGTLTQQTLSGSAASAVQSVGSGGMVYVPEIDAYLLRSGASGGTLYRINAGTFECTTLSTTGGSGIPAAVNGNGPYNKIFYVPRLRGVVYCAIYNGNCWFMRTH